MLDSNSAVLAELQGVSFRRVNRAWTQRSERKHELYEIEWRLEPLRQPSRASQHGAWLILEDSGGVARALSEALTAVGEMCVTVPPASEYMHTLEAQDWRGIVNLHSLDDYELGCRTTLTLLKSLTKSGPRLWLVTAGTQAAGVVRNPMQGALWGFGRVIAREHPDLWGGLIDLDPDDARASRPMRRSTCVISTAKIRQRGETAGGMCREWCADRPPDRQSAWFRRPVT